MSDTDETGRTRVVTAADEGEGAAAPAAVPDAEVAAEPGLDVHVITLRGPDGWGLAHPVQCPSAADCPVEDCAVTEAAGRISRAMCATLGRWTCEVAGGSLMLVQRLGD